MSTGDKPFSEKFLEDAGLSIAAEIFKGTWGPSMKEGSARFEITFLTEVKDHRSSQMWIQKM